MNLEETETTDERELDRAAYDCAWHVVWLVENGHITDITSVKIAAKFLEAYADIYADENCRFRAQKLKNQTN